MKTRSRFGVSRRKPVRYRRNPTFGGQVDLPAVSQPGYFLSAAWGALSTGSRLRIIRSFVAAYGSDYLDVPIDLYDGWVRDEAASMVLSPEPQNKRRETSFSVIASRVADRYRRHAYDELKKTYQRRFGRRKGQAASIRAEYGQRIETIYSLFRACGFEASPLYALQAEILGFEAPNFSKDPFVPSRPREEQEAVCRALAPIIDPEWLPVWRGGLFYEARMYPLLMLLDTGGVVWLATMIATAALNERIRTEPEFGLYPSEVRFLESMREWSFGEMSFSESPGVPMDRGQVLRPIGALLDMTRAIGFGGRNSPMAREGAFEGLRRFPQNAQIDSMFASRVIALLLPTPSLTEM